MTKLTLNGKPTTLNMDPETPLLWAIREEAGLNGTKFGCGAALCGACTVHVNGEAVRSCSTFLADVDGANVTTIEGIASADGTLHAVQEAWIAHQVPQCGYCQSGQIMSAVALLKETPNPSDAEIETFMAGNICRCGMYTRIKAAIKTAAKKA
ncbi:(2Fe-2S)-binding protein [Litorimonas sp. RW-G-Af-16]|uniref:(2Fe-2S)-binding protein n=1 Tax=Litorimonas sp. RW-G-Af-16 TaxID=3241168 RepID=UPI00390C4AC9